MHQIAVIGAGAVGRAVGKSLGRHGHEVLFADSEPRVLAELWAEGQHAVQPEFLSLRRVNIVFLAVPTPTEDGRIITEYVQSASDDRWDSGLAVANDADGWRYRTIAVKSTVPPGTTEEIVIPALERFSGLRAGKDFGVAVNPEYLREAKAAEDFDNPHLTLIGTSNDFAYRTLYELYEPYGVPIARLSIREAEFQKYVHNLFNAAKVSFFNEMRNIARIIGVDPEGAIKLSARSTEGLWNPEYGTRDLGPFGGSCLPKDTMGFLSFAKDHDIEMPLLAATIKVNESLREKIAHVA